MIVRVLLAGFFGIIIHFFRGKEEAALSPSMRTPSMIVSISIHAEILISFIKLILL